MRGVVSGGDGNHSGSQPSVGTYFDEQPVTTIDGTLDMHIYDIAAHRGAGGSAGHPVRREFRGRHHPHHHQQAGSDQVRGRLRPRRSTRSTTAAPAGRPRASSTCRSSPIAAIRLVGWDEHDAGYINNVAGTNASACIVNGVRTFPTWAASRPASTAVPGPVSVPDAGRDRRRRDQQCRLRQRRLQHRRHQGRPRRAQVRSRRQLDRDARASWARSLTTEGFFGYDPAVGDLELAHFGPENSQDSWYAERR